MLSPAPESLLGLLGLFRFNIQCLVSIDRINKNE